MVLFVWVLRVQLLLSTTLILASKTDKGVQTASSLVDFLQSFIRPYMRSANLPVKQEQKITKISKLINEKVLELKDFLQDNDEKSQETEDKVTLRGNMETTTIEFLPKKSATNTTDGADRNSSRKTLNTDPLQTNINRYKNLREQIKQMLDEEKTSEATKNLIINTLDEMIAQLIESQCTWRSSSSYSQVHKYTQQSISRVHSMTKEQWDDLRHQYLDYLQNRKHKDSLFMNQFHQFFSSVINETSNLTERYKIRCQVVQVPAKAKTDRNPLRQQDNLNKNQCETINICSDELREFFNDFYNYVNDTAVSVFKNYAQMYVRDVNSDYGVDKNVVVSTINKLGDKAEHKVSKIYKEELSKFKLDPKKRKSENVKYIKDFIRGTGEVIKNVVKERVIKELGQSMNKLLLTVKEDLLVNLELDMENLERHYIESICNMFLLCNGRHQSRRREEPWTFRPRANSEIYVKVQLTLDDKVKDVIAQSGLFQNLSRERLQYKYAKMRVAHNRSTYKVTRTSITTKYTSIERKRKHHKDHTTKSPKSLKNTRLFEVGSMENQI